MNNLHSVFKTGMEAPEAIAKIAEMSPSISTMYFYAYHPTYNVKESMRGRRGRPLMPRLLYHDFTNGQYKLRRGEITVEKIREITGSLGEDCVLGVMSKVRAGRSRLHIPMMDFDYRKCEARWDIIESFFRQIDQEGIIIHSGRAYHFYGFRLLNEKEWLDFLGKCLLSELVDERYVGHRLIDGCGILRISACPLRPMVPAVITVVTKGVAPGRELMDIRSMPNFEKMKERENEARGLPKDFHRRVLK